MLSRMVDDLFKSLDIDKGEWLDDNKYVNSSSASFMACVEKYNYYRMEKVGCLNRDLTPN